MDSDTFHIETIDLNINWVEPNSDLSINITQQKLADLTRVDRGKPNPQHDEICRISPGVVVGGSGSGVVGA